MKATPYLFAAALLLTACHTQQHIIAEVTRQTTCTQQADSRQAVQSFDSLLRTIAFSADSLVFELAYSTPPIHNAGAACLSTQSNHTQGNHTQSDPIRSVHITAHRPRLTSSAVGTSQTVQAMTTSQTTHTTQQTHAMEDAQTDSTSVASPMNGTVVVIAIAVILALLAAVFLYLFLRKYRIL